MPFRPPPLLLSSTGNSDRHFERGQTSFAGLLEMESARYPLWLLAGEPQAAYPDGIDHCGVGHHAPPLRARPPADHLLDNQAIRTQQCGLGVGSIVLILLLLIFTTGSLLGILLVPVLVVTVAVVAVLGSVASGLFVGERTVSANAGSLMKPFLVGRLILAAIGLVPLVGGFVFLVANLFGFGAVLVSRFGRVQPPAAGSL